MAVYACVIISCLFLCCCLQKFTKQEREIGTSVLLIRERELYKGQFLKFLLWNFEAVLHILFGIFLILWTNWMNSTSREIGRLNIKSFFNRRGLWRCYRCCLSYFFDHLFVRLPSLCLEVCLSFVICLNISLPFIQLLLFDGRGHPLLI